MLAWSRVDGLAAFYALWAGIGLVMATVLYEPAFVVLAKWFPAAGQRRQALTALTLVAALASFIFLPLSQALIDAHGWRDALVILALILAAITIPIHALVLRPAPDVRADAARGAVELGERRAALGAVLAALGRVLPGHLHRHRHDRARRPLSRRARLQRAVRRLRRRADRLLADPRPRPVRRRSAAGSRRRGRPPACSR